MWDTEYKLNTEHTKSHTKTKKSAYFKPQNYDPRSKSKNMSSISFGDEDAISQKYGAFVNQRKSTLSQGDLYTP